MNTARDWNDKSLSDQQATKLNDFLWWKGCCGCPGVFFWFVSFGCLLWGVNFLHEKRQSLSHQYFITIWWFPEVLPPNHRLVFKAKSNVFLSWAICYMVKVKHVYSMIRNQFIAKNDKFSLVDTPLLLRITKAVFNQFVNFNPRKTARKRRFWK